MSVKNSLPLTAGLTAALSLLLQACVYLPQPIAPAAEPVAQNTPQPELRLNLPEPPSIECVRDESADYTFLDKGFSALVAGDHIEAVRYFQSYQRLESSPRADWESGIAIAYDSMMPHSPFYSPQAAGKSYRSLATSQPKGVAVHEKVLLMRDALATFDALNRQLGVLQRDKASLAVDLAKREDALRRLRELTLGQKGSAP